MTLHLGCLLTHRYALEETDGLLFALTQQRFFFISCTDTSREFCSCCPSDIVPSPPIIMCTTLFFQSLITPTATQLPEPRLQRLLQTRRGFFDYFSSLLQFGDQHRNRKTLRDKAGIAECHGFLVCIDIDTSTALRERLIYQGP